MKFMYSKKRVLSVFLSVLTVITMLTPAFSAWAGDVIGVYNIQLFYEDGNAVQDTDAEGNAYHETMKEGDTLLVHGGGAPALMPLLPGADYHPSLVLDGLARWAVHQPAG